jgi:hypothetical protein
MSLQFVKIEFFPLKSYVFRILIIFLTIYSQLISQNEFKKKIAIADELIKNENFEDALDILLELNKEDQKTEEIDYKIGVCYLNTNINKSKAIPYFERFKNKKTDNSLIYYLLGRAYHYSGKFEDAVRNYEHFLKYRKKDDPVSETEAKLYLQQALNASALVQRPLDVFFFNLGDEINSPYADYYPFVDEKENYMIFNSKRPLNDKQEKNPNGQFTSGVFVSKVANGKFLPAEFLGKPVCPEGSGNEIIGMNAKGDIILIMVNDKGRIKLYKSKMNLQGLFGKLEPLPERINESGDVIAACINNEEDEIYFASDRKGGYGGTDLYVCRRLPNGKWAEPENLGEEINTPFDEDFPNLSPDGKTLFFSSKGYSSIGGYDIFKATRSDIKSKFKGVKNMGYPVNTVYDDMNFRISSNGKYGYVASFRGDTKGDLDIYRITFNEVEDDYTVYVGNLKSSDTSEIPYRDVLISVYNVITNDLVGTYVPNPSLGRFVMILPPGKYNLECEAPGYKILKKTIEILDKTSYQREINATLVLEKIK